MFDRKPYIFIIMLALVILGMISKTTLAADPVVLEADEVIYIDHSQQIEALHNVRITYRDTVIHAEKAVMDRETEMVYAEGNVLVEQNGDSFNGVAFIYDIKTERGWATPIEMEVQDESMRYPGFFKAESGYLENDDLFMSHGTFTTCDRPEGHTHYHLKSKRIDYYPDDRIVFHRVWYYERNLPLLYFPYLFISLDNEEDLFEFELGYDATDGWYLYLAYRYDLGRINDGKVYTKQTQHGGDSYGIKNYTRIGKYSRWYQDLAYIDNSNYSSIDYDQVQIGLGYENWANPRFNWKTTLENKYFIDQKDSGYADYLLDLQGVTPYPKITMQYKHDEDYSEYFSFGGSWNYQSNNNFSFNGNGAWYRTEYVNSNNMSNTFRYNLNAQKSWSKSSLAGRIYNSKVVGTTATTVQNYLPELTYKLQNISLGSLGNVSYTGMYTNYEYLYYYNDVLTTERTGERFANDTVRSKTLWNNDKVTLSNIGTVKRRDYLVGGDRSDFTAVTESLNLRRQFFKKLTWNIAANYTCTEGEYSTVFSSAYSDNILDGGSATTSLAYNGKYLRANMATGYNLTYKKYNPMTVSSTLSLFKKLTMSLSSTIYLQDDSSYIKGPGWTSYSLNYNAGSNFYVNSGVNYNFQDDSWGERYLETYLKKNVNPRTRIELAARYSDLLEDFSVLNFATVYDYHCREVAFEYDYVDKKYLLQISFKAFPQAVIGFGPDASEYLYDGINNW